MYMTVHVCYLVIIKVTGMLQYIPLDGGPHVSTVICLCQLSLLVNHGNYPKRHSFLEDAHQKPNIDSLWNSGILCGGFFTVPRDSTTARHSRITIGYNGIPHI